jgi:CheY-like chemotaxis protein
MHHRHGARILVVEDVATIRFTLRLLLERCGYVVTAVESGEAALEELVRSGFDLLLLDVHLTGMSGLEVARHDLARRSGAAILLLTGSAHGDGARGDLLEGFPCLPKTSNPQDVLARIAHAIGEALGTSS